MSYQQSDNSTISDFVSQKDQITFTNAGGRGMHTIVIIQRNGRKIGWIEYSNWRWLIRNCYGQSMGGFEKLDAAKQAALTREYPDPQALYEKINREVEDNRRRHAQEYDKQQIAALWAAARELIAGSSTAAARIEEIVAAVERHAKDREGGRWKPSWGAYGYHSAIVHYPPPPEPDER
jgi:hypothetical protein